MTSRPGLIRRSFGAFWRLLDGTRRLVFNLLFLALLLLVAAAWWAGSHRPTLAPETALVLNLRGDLVEQYAGGSSQLLLVQSLGEERRETRVRDVLDALQAAAADPNIARVVLMLDDLSGGGTASLREVAAALARFRESGKEVLAWGAGYSQRQYFLAAQADEVYLHPFGSVDLRGIGSSGLYFKEALDKLGVTVHSFRVGKFKSAVEPLTRQGPSPEALEADRGWMNDLWATWMTDVERARELPPGSIARLIDEAPQRVAAAGGDLAQLALKEKLVDGVRTRDEFRALCIERGARADAKSGTFRQIALDAYLGFAPPAAGERIGVIVAQGEIIDDDAPQGMVGGRVAAELIRRAREDDAIRAVVLRIDSPGGSVFGSELVRREVELTRAAGKPVVASMGDVAASGGYWIAMAADEIVADPATITGSIGVFGLLPTFEKTLEKVGVGSGGASTTWLANAQSPLRPMDPRYAQLVQARIDYYYQRFVGQVAQARSRTPEQIEAVAQGRVWTGQQAQAQGLVDTLGGLQTALASAARRAHLDGYQAVYLEREPRGIERWLTLFFGQMLRAAQTQMGWTLPFVPSGLEALAGETAGELQRQARLFAAGGNAPLRAYAYCFCAPR